IHFSADGRRIAIQSTQTTIGLYDPATGALEKSLSVAPGEGVYVFHPDGRRLMLTDSSRRTLRLIDIERGEEVWSHAFEAGMEGAAWRGDGRLLAVIGSDH